MDTQINTHLKIRQAAIEYLTRQIQIWNRTAVIKKTLTTKWRKRTFMLILLGTFFGLLSQQVPSETAFDLNLFGFALTIAPTKVFAVCSALSIALASYAGTQILTSDLEKEQIKARSTCEALTVQAYLYLMSAPPYSAKNAEEVLFERVEFILKEVKDIIPFIGKKKPEYSNADKFLRTITLGIYKGKPLEEWALTFDLNMDYEQYFKDRVKGQINGYYLKKAAQFQKVVNRGNSISVIMGFVGIVLGTVAATDGEGLSMWIAFLSTASASIASYLHSNKYEYLMISYVSTANKLELIAAKHQNIPAQNVTGQRKLIAETETIFAMEHNAWISEISGTKDDEAKEEKPAIFQESGMMSSQSGLNA